MAAIGSLSITHARGIAAIMKAYVLIYRTKAAGKKITQQTLGPKFRIFQHAGRSALVYYLGTFIFFLIKPVGPASGGKLFVTERNNVQGVRGVKYLGRVQLRKGGKKENDEVLPFLRDIRRVPVAETNVVQKGRRPPVVQEGVAPKKSTARPEMADPDAAWVLKVSRGEGIFRWDIGK